MSVWCTSVMMESRGVCGGVVYLHDDGEQGDCLLHQLGVKGQEDIGQVRQCVGLRELSVGTR